MRRWKGTRYYFISGLECLFWGVPVKAVVRQNLHRDEAMIERRKLKRLARRAAAYGDASGTLPRWRSI